MRELKFRIFDGKKFWYWGFVKEFNTSRLIFTCPPQFHSPLSPEEIQSQSEQFTGCYDQNGKEIFEGDIVRYHGEYIYLVRWLSTGWIIRTGAKIDLDLDFSEEKEVIGNIHENAELLEKK